MAHPDGYRLTGDDDTERVQVRITPKPYKKVTGHGGSGVRTTSVTWCKTTLTEMRR